MRSKIVGFLFPGVDDNLFAGARTRNRNIEVMVKGADMVEGHLIPASGQARRQRERIKAHGLDTEQSFGDRPAVEAAFGGQMPLVALRPGFYRIRNMLT